MQTAIAKLSDKLHQHPDDSEGWALLGRTYKAMQQYPRARDAFGRAMAAAPDDLDLVKEYAAALTPNPAPAAATDTMPLACGVPELECFSAADVETHSASRRGIIVTQGGTVHQGGNQ